MEHIEWVVRRSISRRRRNTVRFRRNERGRRLLALPQRQVVVVTVTSNNTLERTVNRWGRFVLAMDGVLGEAQWRRWLAAQLGR